MSSTTITIKTDEKLKKDAQAFFQSIGISMSSAFNLFLNDVVTNKSVHFSIKKEEPFGTLYPIAYEDLSEASKEAYHAVETMSEDDFVTYSI